MGLSQQLADFRAEFAKSAPEGRVALYEAKIEELRSSFSQEQSIKLNDMAPDFTLPSASGPVVSLSVVLKQGPAVITFYRGGWCPYCNIQLRAYQKRLVEMKALGARLLAISPQLPDGTLSVVEKNELTFDVLSDVGNRVARSFGIVYEMPLEIQEVLRSVGKALPGINGDDRWELPLTATYVVAPNGRVALAYVDFDYRERLEPEKILAALENLRAS